MALSDILSSIDWEISQLQQARALLSGASSPFIKRKAGRPKRVEAKAVQAIVAPTATPRTKKRNLSPEGRKRIAEAVKRRWAKQKRAAAVSAK